MKLTTKERNVVAMLRELDARQQKDILGQMGRAVLANRISLKVGKLRRLKIPADSKIVRAYGPPGRPKRRGQ